MSYISKQGACCVLLAIHQYACGSGGGGGGEGILGLRRLSMCGVLCNPAVVCGSSRRCVLIFVPQPGGALALYSPGGVLA